MSMIGDTPYQCPNCKVWTVMGAEHTCIATISTCSQHPTDIPGWEGSLEDLAKAVENMRYDKTAEFLGHLANRFIIRRTSDLNAGKIKLSNALYNAYTRTEVVKEYVEEAWKHCAPYMKVK